jgi:hypothetical protein
MVASAVGRLEDFGFEVPKLHEGLKERKRTLTLSKIEGTEKTTS